MEGGTGTMNEDAKEPTDGGRDRNRPSGEPSPVRELMARAPVIPVLVIDDVEAARPLAEALVEGGLPVLEVTLRTPVALAAMRAMAEVEGAVVGVGTALDADDLARARDAGARFAVSPGYTETLGRTARELELPLLPGVATSADVMRARDGGYTELKFFPASQAGGPAMLRALGGPFTDAVFCPTGGVSAATAPEWLALDNVLCVGGSWVAPPALVAARDRARLRALAAEAAALGRGGTG